MYSFYKKLIIADKYEPTKKFNGNVVLLKAMDNYLSLDKDYGLSQVRIVDFNSLSNDRRCEKIWYNFIIFWQICNNPVRVVEIEGNHREILVGESVKKIASVIESLI